MDAALFGVSAIVTLAVCFIGVLIWRAYEWYDDCMREN